MSDDETRLDRRTLIKTLGSAALVGGAVGASSGSAAADPRKTLQPMD